ncbi:hypothetical protein NEUTE2DRAFT_55299, partial [Neurospora tetrasperma FGSC 2509]
NIRKLYERGKLLFEEEQTYNIIIILKLGKNLNRNIYYPKNKKYFKINYLENGRVIIYVNKK